MTASGTPSARWGAPNGLAPSLEPDAPLHVGDRGLVIAQRQRRGAHLAVGTGLQPYARPGFPDHAGANEALPVREIAAGERVAAIIPDVVFEVSLQGDLLGHGPLRADVSPGDQHEARLYLLGRADVAHETEIHRGLRRGGPLVESARDDAGVVAPHEFLVVAAHDLEPPIEARMPREVPGGRRAGRVLVVLVVERLSCEERVGEGVTVRRASVL